MLNVMDEKQAAIAARFPALRATDKLVAWSPSELTAAKVNPRSDGGHLSTLPSACKSFQHFVQCHNFKIRKLPTPHTL
jgi:hypothetical protein